MVLAPKFGLMEPNMRVNGSSTRQTGKESSGTPMGTSSKVTGRMTRLMVSESISMSTVQDTRDSGKMTYKMAGVSKAGLMAANTKAVTRKE